jgi:signal transduction histidine kinase
VTGVQTCALPIYQGVNAQTELALNLPMLHGDRVELQQVLLNLVMNACDAMAGAARGNRQLTIRTDLGPAAGVISMDRSRWSLQTAKSDRLLAGCDYVHISVSDCGAGIAPEKLEQVFDAFYTSKPHGLGLGLAVCRTIITAHGGKVWATNNAAGGATFHFTLPVGKEVSDEGEGRSGTMSQRSSVDELGLTQRGGR